MVKQFGKQKVVAKMYQNINVKKKYFNKKLLTKIYSVHTKNEMLRQSKNSETIPDKRTSTLIRLKTRRYKEMLVKKQMKYFDVPLNHAWKVPVLQEILNRINRI